MKIGGKIRCNCHDLSDLQLSTIYKNFRFTKNCTSDLQKIVYNLQLQKVVVRGAIGPRS